MDDRGDRPRRGDAPRRPDKKRFHEARPAREGSGDSARKFGGRKFGERKFGSDSDRPARKFRERTYGSGGANPKFGDSGERKFGDGVRKDFRSGGTNTWRRKEGSDKHSPHGGGSARDDKRWPRKEFGDNKKWPHKGRGVADDARIHQRDLVRVAGVQAVKTLFAQAPDRIERLFFTPEMTAETAGYRRIMAKARKIFRETSSEDLARIAGTPMHGGIVAVAKPKPIPAFSMADAAKWASSARLLPILHGVANPHNLGAIARTAAFLGLPRLVLTDHPAQAGLSDAALRIAEGGFEALEVYRAEKPTDALRQLRQYYRVLGAAPGRGMALERVPRDRPIALVLGNEEAGLDAATLAACDEAVTIPGADTGSMQSLNVSVAAGILLYMLKPPATQR